MEKWKFAEATPSGSLEYSKFNGSDNYYFHYIGES